MNKKVLTTSIPSWSQFSGADTLSTLFEDYDAENVANIYIRSDVPDSKSCANYFQIIEMNVIKSLFNPKLHTGRRVSIANDSNNSIKESTEIKEKKIYSFFTRYRFRIFLWLRELLWKLGKWNSKELNDFIREFDPDVFVFSIESYHHYNRLNQYIINTYKPKKVIGFLWDDNFTYKQEPYNIFAILDRYFLRRSVFRLVSSCDEVLAICPLMKKECDQEFNIDSIVVTKPSREVSNLPYSRKENGIIRLVYTGSLVIGRFDTIKLMVDTIQEINEEFGFRYFFDIYSQTSLTKSQVESLNIPNSSRFNGSISQSEAFEEQHRADMLVFVENLDNRCKNIARLSFSTKITDYLSTGRCIIAIGPKDISSINYFIEEDAAIVASHRQELREKLISIISDEHLLEYYANQARNLALNKHNRERIKSMFNEIITSSRAK